MNLFIEKNNPRFKRMTRTNQASGLSVCIDMIALSVKEARKEVIDGVFHIEQLIKVYNPRNLILSSIFATDADMMHLRKKYPHLKIYAMIHSNLPFFGAQSEVSQRIMECQRNGVTVIVNDERVSRAIKGSVYAPNIYRGQFTNPVKRRESKTLKVICSGSLRPMKNHITQALAAIKYAEKYNKKLEFYINGDRNEGGVPVLCNLKSIFEHNSRHELINTPWLDHKEFMATLNEFDIGLQVSLSESFNIVAGDYTARGLPMVVSSEIDWASQNCFANPHDVDSIVDVMERCHLCVEDNQKRLRKWSYDAVEKWNALLA